MNNVKKQVGYSGAMSNEWVRCNFLKHCASFPEPVHERQVLRKSCGNGAKAFTDPFEDHT